MIGARPTAAARRASAARLTFIAALLGLAGGCTIQERTDRSTPPAEVPPASEFLSPWGASEPPRAVRSGNLLWIWGMPGAVPAATPPRLVEGGAGAETRQALANIAQILSGAGVELREVAQCSLFVADSADLAAATSAYLEYFPSPPARTAIASGALTMDARVEVECTAVVSGGS